MTRIVLQPCKVRGTRFVPDKDQGPVELDWPLLVFKLAPSRTKVACSVLARLQKGFYVGLLSGTPIPSNFVIRAAGVRGNDFSSMTRQNPSWKDRVLEVYRVEEFDLGTSWKPLEDPLK